MTCDCVCIDPPERCVESRYDPQSCTCLDCAIYGGCINGGGTGGGGGVGGGGPVPNPDDRPIN